MCSGGRPCPLVLEDLRFDFLDFLSRGWSRGRLFHEVLARLHVHADLGAHGYALTLLQLAPEPGLVRQRHPAELPAAGGRARGWLRRRPAFAATAGGRGGLSFFAHLTLCRS